MRSAARMCCAALRQYGAVHALQHMHGTGGGAWCRWPKALGLLVNYVNVMRERWQADGRRANAKRSMAASRSSAVAPAPHLSQVGFADVRVVVTSCRARRACSLAVVSWTFGPADFTASELARVHGLRRDDDAYAGEADRGA